ncbi:MAG: hypothetical protein KAI57_03625 [Candidatus Pacebacteria bacterium]|nr:hypothetical protein [Candidatus Paceibacterota bacterium]
MYAIARKNEKGIFVIDQAGDNGCVQEYTEQQALDRLQKSIKESGTDNIILLSIVPIKSEVKITIPQD